MATKSDGTIILNTRLDTKGFETGINDLKGDLKSSLDGLSQTVKKMGTVVATAFAIDKVIDFGKKAIELGSDLQEVQNVVDVTFSSMSERVNDFAQNAYKSFGLSETMAKRYTGTFGAMAKSFGFTEKEAYNMSTALAGLTGDVASFYNLSQDESYTKLKSVFTGETESLKDLGVVMTQTALDSYALANGFGKTVQQMTEQEKVALRYRFVMDQLSGASGDFARTSNSWANQTRLLQLQMESFMATVGQGLINVFTPVIRVINMLMSKLQGLANAFKNLTVSIFGDASSGSSASKDVNSLGDAYSDVTDNLSDYTEAQEEANKALNDYLSPLDEISKYSIDDSSTNIDASIPSFDLGNSKSEFENIDNAIEKTSTKFEKLIERVKDLSNIFNQGFEIGFGNSDEKIQSIKQGVQGIGTSIKDILFDPAIVQSSNALADAIILNIGKITGSALSIGLTTADNLIGGIDSYLSKNQSYIKERIISIFNVSAEIANLTGDFTVSIAKVFDVFANESAKGISENLIGIISDTFLGILNLGLLFVTDIANLVTAPFVDNTEEWALALENLLQPISSVLDTIHTGVQDTFVDMMSMYQKHVAPMFENLEQGFSDVVKVLLDGYNRYIAPVLDKIASKFDTSWKEHIQPMIGAFIDLLGTLADNIQFLWDNTFYPFLMLLAEIFGPAISKVIDALSDDFWLLFDSIVDVITAIIQIADGLIDFMVGTFTGDWKRVVQGLVKIFDGVFAGILNVGRNILNSLIDTLNRAIDGINSIRIPDWVPGFGGKNPSIPRIPHLASGAVIPPRSEFLAVLGDQKQGTNIETPEALLRQIMREELNALRNNQQGGGTYHFTAQINRRTLFDEFIAEAKMRQMQTGKNPLEI